jgi:hypothetical protein
MKHSSPILTPILFLIFNRPENTRQVFDSIRRQKPKYLYIAADGPRSNIDDDNEICLKTREIALQIDWDCQVKTLFREHNLGCKVAVSSAISWFFENVDEGIILEDDCLPDAGFFPFCTELLLKYRTDNQVMSISGSNLLNVPWKAEAQSYQFAHGGIWGWATWKRAWNLYDITMQAWQYPATKKLIRKNMQTQDWYQYYQHMFESTHNGQLDTWDIQWFYTILINNGLAINPSVNLVKNIGFTSGTHINADDSIMGKLSLNTMHFPLIHPAKQDVDVDYLKAVYKTINPASNNLNLLKKLRAYFR